MVGGRTVAPDSLDATRLVGQCDLAEVRRLVDRDPWANVFVDARLAAAGLDRWRLGAQVWGYPSVGPLQALCYLGSNLLPLLDAATDPGFSREAAAGAFAARAAAAGRRCLSVVGTRTSVGPVWDRLQSVWGPARDVRGHQPYLVLDRDPTPPLDPAVRAVRPEEIDVLYPASVAMFTEEVGVSPELSDGGAAYRASVAELIRSGRAFARIERGEVVFKAEVGVVSPRACQVQGVWVAPRLRGRGLAAPGMAAVAALARSRCAPVVTLYVNDFNARARRAYRDVGFREHTVYMSVLL